MIISFIQRSMAKPLPIHDYKPALPERPHLTINLKQHTHGIQPLDSLPKPFTWLVESSAFIDFVKKIAYSGAKVRFDEYIKLAQDSKAKGNEALAKCDRGTAIKSFKEGIMHRLGAMNTRPMDDLEKCAQFPSDTSLKPRSYVPEGMDAKQALVEGLKAEYMCSS